MNRTDRLVRVLVLLTLTFVLYIICTNYDKIILKVDKLFDKVAGYEVIVPVYMKNNRNYNYETMTLTNSFEPRNIEDIKKIYYTVLNNGWDEFTFYCRSEYTNCISDIKKIADDSNYIALINNYVSPYNSYKKYNTSITGDKEIYLKIEKLYTEDDKQVIDRKIEKIFNELNVTKENVNEETIKKLHNYLIKNTIYDNNYLENENGISNKATGLLLNGLAVCSGYADTFAIMMDKLDIPNFKVSTLDHIWNVIYLEDRWYHIDVTWDDDEVNKDNYYNFFLVTTKELLEKDKKDHTFNISDYIELLNQE